ncbi:MFS transporter [Mycolicibacterium mengxianglii]|uniref:MFS transporter n=1 Tax=Mycolicibacterium mengxianglii TaxID=2736649 RepID=UPI0018D1B434|nr:MFS transporter [Mycolicibacterium mengxianglii]
MTTTGGEVRTDTQSGMARVAAASFVGTAVEYYDFFLFGTAAALIFGGLFFPGADPLSGTLLSFATFGVGFFARPLGGIIAGHLGDRIGRKKTLVATLLLMGTSTTAVGLLPSYEVIGAWAPIALVALRLLQGLGVGGEWGGAALLAVEHAPPARRGFYGSWPQMGIPAGLLLSSGAFALVSALPQEDFISWGWRLPFIASSILVIIGLYIRAKISEPPAFKEIMEASEQVKRPLVEVLRKHPRDVAVIAGIRFADNVLYYVFATFGLAYMTTQLGLPRSVALAGVLVASAIELVTMPLFGALSDRIGRRHVVVMGTALMLLLAFPFFWLVGTGEQWAVILACVLALAGAHSMVFAPLSAWFAELFSADIRYTGVSVGYQMGSLLAGAPAPILATYLVSVNDGAYWPVSAMVIAAGIVTLVAAYAARDNAKAALDAPTNPRHQDEMTTT